MGNRTSIGTSLLCGLSIGSKSKNAPQTEVLPPSVVRLTLPNRLQRSLYNYLNFIIQNRKYKVKSGIRQKSKRFFVQNANKCSDSILKRLIQIWKNQPPQKPKLCPSAVLCASCSYLAHTFPFHTLPDRFDHICV